MILCNFIKDFLLSTVSKQYQVRYKQPKANFLFLSASMQITVLEI